MKISNPPPRASLSSLTDADKEFLQAIASDPGFTTQSATMLEGAAASLASQQIERHPRYRVTALLGDFDPTALMPGISERELGALLADCTVSNDGSESRWRLTIAARARLLKEMTSTGTLGGTQRSTRAWLKEAGQKGDAITDALLELTSGKRRSGVELASLGKESWAAYQAVLPALNEAQLLDEGEADVIRSHLEHAELLEPFRFLTGCDAVSDTDTFVGREKELERLRAFVNVLASQSVKESITRGVEGIFGSDERVLVLSGVGGVGKSTLAAKFMLQHAEYAGQNEWFRFAYLDFDRSTVHAVQPITLLLEMIRQLGWQVPAVKVELEELRQRIERVVSQAMSDAVRNASSIERAGSDMALPEELLGPTVLFDFIRGFTSAIKRTESPECVLLLVLDTFEEAQALGDEAVKRIEQFLSILIQQLERSVRILVIGRDEARELLPSAPRMILKEFRDLRSRRAFLERRGVNAEVSERVAKAAGGLPLALLLAALLVREHGIESITLSLYQRLNAWLRESFTVGILYKRILEHIQDETVRKVVHPGLVLRRLDPEVIRSIVVPVLGLRDFDDARIDKTMALLRRQKDLVRVQLDGSVTHRPDVRVQMIGLLAAEDPALAKRLHAQAIDFYSRRQQGQDPAAQSAQRDRVEELYHRLCLGEALGVVVDRWIPRARMELARSLEEIASEPGQRALRVMLGRPLTDEEASSLPDPLKRLFATQAVTTALAAHAPERALQVFDRFEVFVDPAIADLYYPLAFDRAGRWSEARPGYERLAGDLSETGLHQKLGSTSREHIDRLLAVADYFERADFSDRHRGSQRWIEHRLWDAARDGLTGPTAFLRYWLRAHGGVEGGRDNHSVPTDLFALVDRRLGPDEVNWALATDVNFPSIRKEVADHVPRTERPLQQIQFLMTLLTRKQAGVPGEADVLQECTLLLNRGEKRLPQSLRNLDIWDNAAAAKVLRHVMRPSTPQWYVPLAASLRAIAGPSIRTDWLYGKSLPELPLELPQRSSTTRSVADLLGLFDQFGVLAHVLDRLLDRESRLRDASSFHSLVAMYRQWRADLLMVVDSWMVPLLDASAAPFGTHR